MSSRPMSGARRNQVKIHAVHAIPLSISFLAQPVKSVKAKVSWL